MSIDMNQENLCQLKALNDFIKKMPWCDFDFLEYKGNTLSIVGSTDFSYFHELEVKFEDVFFIQCNTSWHTDTSSDIFICPSIEEQQKINSENSIEEGYFLFKIVPEEGGSFFISAKSIKANFEKVYYNS